MKVTNIRFDGLALATVKSFLIHAPEFAQEWVTGQQ
jgi:hypothetical protein